MAEPGSEQVATPLSAWSRAMDQALADGEAEIAARMAHVVLTRLPRHLATYNRLLLIAWQTKRWQEGEEWGRRLLQADPGNARAWSALARAAEQRNQRGQAQTIWQRAFEVSPYDPDIRAGLSRTSLDSTNALAYNAACLAALHLCDRRWELAAENYRQLVQVDRRRIDFQVCLAVALWQSGSQRGAYAVARHVVEHHPYLLMGWRVLRETGDENDRALAANPVETMDPDGEFAETVWGVARSDAAASISVRKEEAALLEAMTADER